MIQKRKQLSPRKNVPQKREKICDMLPGMCMWGSSTHLKDKSQTEAVKKANRKTNKTDQVVSITCTSIEASTEAYKGG